MIGIKAQALGGGVSQALGDESFANANDFLLDGNGVST